MVVPGRCGEIVLPQGRSAFYADEAIELAVAGLARGQAATIAMVPQGEGAGAGTPGGPGRGGWLDGRGGAAAAVPRPRHLRGHARRQAGSAGPLIVSAGVNDSTMLITQTIEHRAGAGDRREFLPDQRLRVRPASAPTGCRRRTRDGRSGGLDNLRPGGGRSTCRRSFTCTGPAT